MKNLYYNGTYIGTVSDEVYEDSINSEAQSEINMMILKSIFTSPEDL